MVLYVFFLFFAHQKSKPEHKIHFREKHKPKSLVVKFGLVWFCLFSYICFSGSSLVLFWFSSSPPKFRLICFMQGICLETPFSGLLTKPYVAFDRFPEDTRVVVFMRKPC
ncbi:hypothetical protein R6Q59_005579 [Mikania micrantha]